MGRAEVKRSLGSRKSETLSKVSTTQVRLNVNFVLKTVELTSLGRNQTSIASFGKPIVLLKKEDTEELVQNDLIGFGPYKNLFQIRFIDEFATPKKKRKKAKETTSKEVWRVLPESSESESEAKENQGELQNYSCGPIIVH